MITPEHDDGDQVVHARPVGLRRGTCRVTMLSMTVAWISTPG